ncbi:hypothetical protein [Clostridium manihotivorum]|uniref:Phage-Barnase-EndoU-ColicinE5/D-RelE like nuclease 3 domain-containing protein n=1 Tax=Clostridium manihotivorum TaxID=2320868 RepID=A0A3R5V6J0_9CLOT|nr:hypothetical protein [Clostridium manihotivorum]QAA31311.1 hypothetical protein C1I91_06460 [Clostridium manihotivorum]
MRYYYDGKAKVFKMRGRVHDKIILYNVNYKKHIKIRHPEIDISKIDEILKEPDFVYKSSTNTKIYYYEKEYLDYTYRVVIGSFKKSTKEVITAYKVNNKNKLTIKHAYCVYDKETHLEFRAMKRELYDDLDYYYKLFNIAE